ncbi:MAG: hypothetical protein ACI93P_000619 [bacterium]|jgi:hypothetical protein
MKNFKYTLISSCILCLFGLLACETSLNVQNENEPDIVRAFSNPNDLVNAVGGGLLTWWNGANGNQHPGLALAIGANFTTGERAGAGQEDFSVIPRIAYPNSVFYNRQETVDNPWFQNYAALAAANAGLRALNNGVKLDSPQSETMLTATAQLLQGLSLGHLGIWFDKAVIVDENSTEEEIANSQFAPYGDVVERAVEKLDAAILTASTGSFSLPDGFISGYDASNPFDNVKLAQFANTMAARFLMNRARTLEENLQTDWIRVLSYARKGVKGWDFAPAAQGADEPGLWVDSYKRESHRPDRIRTSNEIVGIADNSGKLAAWLALPPNDRRPIIVQTDDRRVTAAGDPTAPGLYFAYNAKTHGSLSRGWYRQSRYYPIRYASHTGFIGSSNYCTEDENDLIIAEALLRTNGSNMEAVTIINKTRVTNGQLPALNGTESKEVLLNALMYERLLELGYNAAGLTYGDKRRWEFPGPYVRGNGSGVYQHYVGTPRSLPIPARELQTLGLDVYTFGGPTSADE